MAKETPQIADAADARPLERIRGEIVFDHVGYERGGQVILQDVSFRIAPGETLGIMGMTGTGKTTIVNLLQRFYDVTSGRILLDGQDIRAIPLIQLRAAMSVVMQEVFLFSLQLLGRFRATTLSRSWEYLTVLPTIYLLR